MNRKPFILLTLFISLLLPSFLLADAQSDLKKAQLAYDAEKYQEALEKVESILQKNAYYRDALLLKGKAYDKIGETEKARLIWTDLLRRDPTYKPVLFALGDFQFRAKKYDDSLKHYSRILELDTLNQDAKLSIARIKIEKGLYEEAETALKEVNRLNPLHPRLYFLYGEFYLKQRKLDLAKENFIRSKNLDPTQPEVHSRLAQIIQKQNDPKAAEYHYNQAVILDNRNIEHYAKLSDFYLRQKEWSRLYDVYKESENRFQTDPVFFYNYALTADKTGRQDEAIKYIEKSLVLDSENPFSQMLYYYKLRNYDEPEKQKTYAQTYFKKADEAYNNGLFRDALFFLRKGLKLDPGSEENRYLLANTFKRLGYEKTYIKELKIATDLNPDIDKWNYQLERDERKFIMDNGTFRNEQPERTTTKILILPFESETEDFMHLEAGLLLAKELELFMNNYFRIDAVMMDVTNLPSNETLNQYDYVVRGTYLEKDSTLKISASLYLVHDMARKAQYQEYTKDNNRVTVMTRNISKKLYTDLPFLGQVYKIDNENYYVNLGKKDDFAITNKLVLYRPASGSKFTVTKANTLGKLKIVNMYEDFLIAQPIGRELQRISRLYDKIQIDRSRPPQNAGKTK